LATSAHHWPNLRPFRRDLEQYVATGGPWFLRSVSAADYVTNFTTSENKPDV